MAVRIKRFSPLQFHDLFTVDGFEFWDLGVFPEIPKQFDDRYHQVKSVDRIDLLAFDYYGDPTLWFVIALANNLELLPSSLNVGMKLRIPSPAYITNTFFAQLR